MNQRQLVDKMKIFAEKIGRILELPWFREGDCYCLKNNSNCNRCYDDDLFEEDDM